MTDEDQRPLFVLSMISYVFDVIILQITFDRVRALTSSTNKPRETSATVDVDLLKVSCESYLNECIQAYGSSLGKKSFKQRCPSSEVHVIANLFSDCRGSSNCLQGMNCSFKLSYSIPYRSSIDRSPLRPRAGWWRRVHLLALFPST